MLLPALPSCAVNLSFRQGKYVSKSGRFSKVGLSLVSTLGLSFISTLLLLFFFYFTHNIMYN